MMRARLPVVVSRVYPILLVPLASAVLFSASYADPLPSLQPRSKTVSPAALRYLAIGGGATPESTEVSLEQNLRLAEEILPGPGRLFFAGGKGSRSVRTLDPERGASLLVRLGELFQPRGGRDSRYRPTVLPAAAASRERIDAVLEGALTAGSAPLLLFLSTHGEQGKAPRDNRVLLWGGGSLSPTALSELHDKHPRRPLRVVATSCFSGGFAELAFRGGDERNGPAKPVRCGLFAGTWDRETSGCDPDPDRRKQEGYSLHFLNALAQRDRDGRPLPVDRVDFDGDGRVSLLEAHARASIESVSLDVPTTTSERYLRSVAPEPAQPDAALLPEQAGVVSQLGRRLGLPDATSASLRWDRLDRGLAQLEDRLAQAEERANERYWPLAAALLARWPMLDDPYHPAFAATLARDADAIEQVLERSHEAAAYARAMAELDRLDMRHFELLREEAQVARLIRARETLELAAGLRVRGGPEFRYYRRLLSCERALP